MSECMRENVSVSECVWENVQTLSVCVSASVCSSECVYVCLSASSCVWVCVCACMSASMCVCVYVCVCGPEMHNPRTFTLIHLQGVVLSSSENGEV